MQLSRFALRCYAAALLAAAAVAAQAQSSSCPNPKVFFVNGVWNSLVEAWGGSRALEAAFIANGAPADLHIQTHYNPTDGRVGDLQEIAADYLMAGRHLTALWWLAYAADVARNLGIAPATPTLAMVVDFEFRDTYRATLQSLIDDTNVATRNESVISGLQQTILTEVRDNKRPVVFIAHSEGNFYLNEAVRRLKTEPQTKDIPGIQAVGVLGLGVASRIDLGTLDSGAELYRYVTKVDDLIVAPLAENLRANLTQVSDLHPWPISTGHLLIDHYLSTVVTGRWTDGRTLTTQQLASELFSSVYAATGVAWPCVGDPFVSYTAGGAAVSPTVGVPTLLQARVTPRGGRYALRTGTITYEVDGITACSAAVGSDGLAPCVYRFPRVTAGASVVARWVSTSGLFTSASSTVTLPVLGAAGLQINPSRVVSTPALKGSQYELRRYVSAVDAQGVTLDTPSSLQYLSSVPDIVTVDDTGSLGFRKLGAASVSVKDPIYGASTCATCAFEVKLVDVSISPSLQTIGPTFDLTLVDAATGRPIDLAFGNSWTTSDPTVVQLDQALLAAAVAQRSVPVMKFVSHWPGSSHIEVTNEVTGTRASADIWVGGFLTIGGPLEARGTSQNGTQPSCLGTASMIGTAQVAIESNLLRAPLYSLGTSQVDSVVSPCGSYSQPHVGSNKLVKTGNRLSADETTTYSCGNADCGTGTVRAIIDLTIDQATGTISGSVRYINRNDRGGFTDVSGNITLTSPIAINATAASRKGSTQ